LSVEAVNSFREDLIEGLMEAILDFDKFPLVQTGGTE